jgi:hypothetical protein
MGRGQVGAGPGGGGGGGIVDPISVFRTTSGGSSLGTLNGLSSEI